MRKLGGVMLKRRKDQPMHRSPSGQWAGIDGPNAPRSEHASSNMHSASCFEKVLHHQGKVADSKD